MNGEATRLTSDHLVLMRDIVLSSHLLRFGIKMSIYDTFGGIGSLKEPAKDQKSRL
jgi:hypothetical protein